MESVLEQIEEWFRNMLIEGIMEHLTNTFSSLNTEVGEISNVVGQTPAEFLPSVYNLIRTLSENLMRSFVKNSPMPALQAKYGSISRSCLIASL